LFDRTNSSVLLIVLAILLAVVALVEARKAVD